MAQKKEIYHVQPLTEGKKNIIAALMDEYDIQNTDDIQKALKDLLGGTHVRHYNRWSQGCHQSSGWRE